MRTLFVSIISLLLLALALTPFATPLRAYAQSAELYVSNSNGNSVSVLDPSTGSTITTITTGTTPRGIVFNGTYIYVANSNSPNITVIDPATNNVVTSIQLGPNAPGPERMTLSPDNTTLYASDVNNTVY